MLSQIPIDLTKVSQDNLDKEILRAAIIAQMKTPVSATVAGSMMPLEIVPTTSPPASAGAWSACPASPRPPRSSPAST